MDLIIVVNSLIGVVAFTLSNQLDFPRNFDECVSLDIHSKQDESFAKIMESEIRRMYEMVPAYSGKVYTEMKYLLNSPIKVKSIFVHVDKLCVATDLQEISIKLPKDLIRELELLAKYQKLNLEAIIYLGLDEYAQHATSNTEIFAKKR